MESKSEFTTLREECACRSHLNFEPAPGQRALNSEHVTELEAVIRSKTPGKRVFMPLSCIQEGQTIYIIDGQHRYQAFLQACQKESHHPLYLTCCDGSRDDAADEYRQQILGLPQHISESKEVKTSELVARTECVKHLMSLGGELAKTVEAGRKTINRPYFEYNQLVDSYPGQLETAAFKVAAKKLNTFCEGLLKKKCSLSEANIGRMRTAGVFFGVIKPEFYGPTWRKSLGEVGAG